MSGVTVSQRLRIRKGCIPAYVHRGVFCARQLRLRKLSGERSGEMSLPRSGGLLLALGAIVWPACGGGESGTSAGASAVAKSTPATAASTPTAPPASSPGGSKAGSAETSQKGTFDPGAEYDKGAALAAARRFADARQVFEEAARLAPADGCLGGCGCDIPRPGGETDFRGRRPAAVPRDRTRQRPAMG